MTGRRLVLMVALYVAMDLANPWMPGAFVFDAAACVEGLSVPRDSGRQPAIGRSPADTETRRPVATARMTSPASPHRVPSPGARGVALKRGHAAGAETPSAADDH